VTVANKSPSTSPLRLVTVNCVGVALVTVPVAPPLNVTVSSATAVEKPEPWIVKVVALPARRAEPAVTTGWPALVAPISSVTVLLVPLLT